jgi:hypothetical protein
MRKRTTGEETVKAEGRSDKEEAVIAEEKKSQALNLCWGSQPNLNQSHSE